MKVICAKKIGNAKFLDLYRIYDTIGFINRCDKKYFLIQTKDINYDEYTGMIHRLQGISCIFVTEEAFLTLDQWRELKINELIDE